MMNPFGIAGSWNIDPDNRQDRGNGKVRSYKLSPEDIENLIRNNPVPVKQKHKPFSESIEQIKKNKMEAENIMSKITIEQLVEECKKLGFTHEAYTEIAKRYGFSNAHSVACMVSKQKIKKLIASEQKDENVQVRASEPVITPQNKFKEQNQIIRGNATITDQKILEVEQLLEGIQRIVKENETLKQEKSKIKAELEYILNSLT